MAQTKIADFFAELGIKVNERSLRTLEKNLSKIVSKLEKVESQGRSMSGILKGVSKQADAENKSIQAGNKVLAEREKKYRKLNSVYKKAQDLNNRYSKINARNSVFADPNFAGMRASRWSKASSKNSRAWQSNFKQSVSGLTSGASNMSNKARAAQQAMYDKLFGATSSPYAGLDKLHGAAIREDQRRLKSAQNIARIQENVARREQQMAQRTAAIREAGAARAAALIRKAEIQAQAMANRVTGGSAGGRGGSIMGRATIGGALGAATSNMSGLIPGFGAGFAAVNFNRIGQDMIASENAMRALSPDNATAQSNLDFITSMAEEMGGSIVELNKQFTSIYASTRDNIGAEKTQDIFRGISKYGTVLGLDQESMKGSFRAVSQMFSKDRITAEEARSQLAERMPAAMQMLANAVPEAGGSTSKLNDLMAEGKLDPKKIMPEFARIAEELAMQNQAYAKALETSRTAQGRMTAEFQKFILIFAKAGGDQGFKKIFDSITNFFKENPKLAGALANALNKIGDAAKQVSAALTNLTIGFDKLGDSLGIGGVNLGLFAAGALVLATHFGRIAAALGLFLLVLEDISVGAQGGNSYTKDFIDFLNGDSLGAGAVKMTAIAVAVGSIAMAFIKVRNGILGATAAFTALSSTMVASPIAGLLVKAGILTAAAAPVIATAGLVAAPLLAATALVPEGATERSNSFRNQMTSRFGSGQGGKQPMPYLPGINSPTTTPSPYQSIVDSMVKSAISKPAVNIGEVSVVFNGTPEQMMGSNEFSSWFTAELTKAAVEVVGEH